MSAPILTTAQNAALAAAQADFDNGFTSGFEAPGGATVIVPIPNYQSSASAGTPPVDYRPIVKAGFLAAMVNTFRYLYKAVETVTTPTPGPGWTANLSFITPGYYKDPSGFVHLQGRYAGTVGTVFTLPAGYLPSGSIALAGLGFLSGAPTFVSINISTSGAISVTAPTSIDSVSLDGLMFQATS